MRPRYAGGSDKYDYGQHGGGGKQKGGPSPFQGLIDKNGNLVDKTAQNGFYGKVENVLVE